MPSSHTVSRNAHRHVIRVGRIARYDAGRELRTGAPEVVLGEGKRVDHLVHLLMGLASAGRGAFVSRLTPAQADALRAASAEKKLPVTVSPDGRLARLEGRFPTVGPSGRVAIVTAGTSDVPLADEARWILEGCGAEVFEAHDVGVAGLHRLQTAVRRLERRRPHVYLAFAGREGALPTVLAGLVRAPVVGVPTSVGYGRGARGEAALGAMLQSCAPIAVVNIDGAVPAALFALQLLAGASR